MGSVVRQYRLLAAVALLAVCGAAPLSCARPASAPIPEAPDYTLTVRILPEERAIDVAGIIRMPAADDSRQELVISLNEHLNELRIDVVQPLVSAGAATLERVSHAGERVEGERGNSRWVLRLRSPVPAGQPVTLRFSARGSGEAAFLYYVGPEVAFGSGWGDPWYPVVQGVGGKGTGELTVYAPPGWTAITGATRRSSNEEEAQGTFRFSQQLPTYFTFIAGRYTQVRRAGEVPVTAWLLTPREHIDGYLSSVSSMMEVLSREFGTYAFGDLELVEVPRTLATEAGFNAFSAVGLLVLNHRAFDVPDVKYLLEWLGHELSHQWFPHAITFDPAGFPYFEEALAEYGGLRVVEELAGADAARRLRTSGFEYDPIYSAAAYFRLVGAGVDQPLALMGYGIHQRNLAYNKGALVFDMLAREIGRSSFQRIMVGLTHGRRLQSITWQQFREALTVGTGRNLDWFFDQWLMRAGAPAFEVAWRQDGGVVRGTITQSVPHFRANLKLVARSSSGQSAEQIVEIRGADATFEIPVDYTVERVLLDPDYEVLRWTAEFRAIADSARAARSSQSTPQ